MGGMFKTMFGGGQQEREKPYERFYEEDRRRQQEYEEEQRGWAREMWGLGQSVREPFTAELAKFAEGAYDPTESQLFAPLFAQGKGGIESQYGVARENILANLPEGGAKQQALANLEMTRAQQGASLPAMISMDIYQDMLNKAYGIASGAPMINLTGGSPLLGADVGLMGQEASREAMEEQARMAEQGAMYQAIGSLLGMGLGGLAGRGGGS